jgi:hypothetical protein
MMKTKIAMNILPLKVNAMDPKITPKITPITIPDASNVLGVTSFLGI